jgi:hypothetical protein
MRVFERTMAAFYRRIELIDIFEDPGLQPQMSEYLHGTYFALALKLNVLNVA